MNCLHTGEKKKKSQAKPVLHCYVHCIETALPNKAVSQPVMMDI